MIATTPRKDLILALLTLESLLVVTVEAITITTGVPEVVTEADSKEEITEVAIEEAFTEVEIEAEAEEATNRETYQEKMRLRKDPKVKRFILLKEAPEVVLEEKEEVEEEVEEKMTILREETSGKVEAEAEEEEKMMI